MVLKEVECEKRNYMYTATLNNGVIIQAFEDATAEGSDGRRYRLTSHIDPCEFYDVFDETIVDGWELIEEE